MSKKNCQCYDCTWKKERQEFLHTHGGPEEMPHRPKRKKNTGSPRSDHKHIWETNGWQKQYHARYDGKRGCYVTDKNSWYSCRTWECLECGKAGNREYDWNRKTA